MRAAPALLLAALPLAAGAQSLPKAIALVSQTIYLSPDAASAKLGTLQPGEGLGLQSTSGTFVQVFAGANYRGVSGWIPNRGYVRLDDPQAADVLFGTAVRLQYQAEDESGQRQAALNAAAIYRAVYDNFPASPRASEAFYRSASIPWELQMSEEPRRRTPEERQFPSDEAMHKVINKLAHTPWAARAEFEIIVEHFTCGDWYAKPECVEKEAGRYQDYLHKYPDSPDAAEAAYDAIYREAIAWTLYRAAGPHPNPGKADQYQRAVADDAAALAHQFPQSDWSAQAALVAFNVAHNSPLTVPSPPPLGGP